MLPLLNAENNHAKMVLWEKKGVILFLCLNRPVVIRVKFNLISNVFISEIWVYFMLMMSIDHK